MSGRFAKSRSLDELWENLAAGRDLVDEVKRWDLEAHYDAESIPDEVVFAAGRKQGKHDDGSLHGHSGVRLSPSP